ncbi:hypothetical protein BAE44_0012910 [Dichanthelium oligosanthes]|uniref:Uncharacterized protein n=1 Tax=Dichanthelium oligosanthes TaxID=888268 RepID=A0A1E5VLR2_9POAL|nr:hypothetical protein BAE44_0012910 [Dichanthelium oligosanthes]
MCCGLLLKTQCTVILFPVKFFVIFLEQRIFFSHLSCGSWWLVSFFSSLLHSSPPLISLHASAVARGLTPLFGEVG